MERPRVAMDSRDHVVDIHGCCRSVWIHPHGFGTLRNDPGSLTYPQPLPLVSYPSLLVNLASILWQFWDPTWKALQRTRLQGYEARIEGKNTWLVSLNHKYHTLDILKPVS